MIGERGDGGLEGPPGGDGISGRNGTYYLKSWMVIVFF